MLIGVGFAGAWKLNVDTQWEIVLFSVPAVLFNGDLSTEERVWPGESGKVYPYADWMGK